MINRAKKDGAAKDQMRIMTQIHKTLTDLMTPF